MPADDVLTKTHVTRAPEWTMPAHLEPFREFIVNTGGNSVESLMNDRDSNLFNNGPRVCLIVAVKSQIGLLNQLLEKGLLMEPA